MGWSSRRWCRVCGGGDGCWVIEREGSFGEGEVGGC